MASEPVGYLITFRTYGSWLHGDPRGSVDRNHRVFGTEFVPPNRAWEREANRVMRQSCVRLDRTQRQIVLEAIRRTAALRDWTLHAVQVRTEHAHVVVSSPEPPESVLRSLKAWCTRCLRRQRVLPANRSVWSRHGSTVYLWNEKSLHEASRYVMESQGEAL